MAQDRPQNTELTTQYATQVAADLVHNAREQERVNAELVALQEQLEALRDDRTVLDSIRHTLTGDSPATGPADSTEASGATRAPKRKAAKARKAAQTAEAEVAPVPAPRAKPAQDSAQPTLGSLIREYLGTQGTEPRSIAEVTQALAASHPERGVKGTVVRTTIEGLVAKGRVQRHKQGGSVFYTVTDAASADDDTAAPTAQPEHTEQAEQSEPAEQAEPVADTTPQPPAPDEEAPAPAEPTAAVTGAVG